MKVSNSVDAAAENFNLNEGVRGRQLTLKVKPPSLRQSPVKVSPLHVSSKKQSPVQQASLKQSWQMQASAYNGAPLTVMTEGVKGQAVQPSVDTSVPVTHSAKSLTGSVTLAV